MTNSSETEPRSVAVNSKRVGIAMVAGVALAAAAAGGWLLFIDGDPERSAATTVREFVEAQRAGDCEAILGLLSEESRTDRGRLSQYEFLDLCATATKGVTAEVDSVELLSQVGDRATVGLSVRVAEEKYTHSIDLVAEDGEWRLDTTHGRFRIGRSYPEILHAFFRALENHDCGQMAELQAKTAGDSQDRGDYLEWCSGLKKDLPLASGFSVSSLVPDGENGLRATVTADVELSDGRPSTTFRETISLVYEDLVWRIRAGGSFGGPKVVDALMVAGVAIEPAPILSIAQSPNSFMLLLDLDKVGDRYAADATEYGGAPKQVSVGDKRSLGKFNFEYGVRTMLRDDSLELVSVDVLVFENEAGASGYAEDLARRFREIEPRSGGGVDDTRVAEPSGMQGVVLRHYDGDPTDAYLVQAKGNKVVRVVARNMTTGADPLSYAVQALTLQLERL